MQVSCAGEKGSISESIWSVDGVFGGRSSPKKEGSLKIWTPHKQVWKVRNREMIRIEELERQDKGADLHQVRDVNRSDNVMVKELQKPCVEKSGLTDVERGSIGRIIPNWSADKEVEKEEGMQEGRNISTEMKEVRFEEARYTELTDNVGTEEEMEDQGALGREML